MWLIPVWEIWQCSGGGVSLLLSEKLRFLQFVAKRLVFLPYGAQQDHVIWLNDINPSWVAHLELIHYSRMVVEFPVIIT
jgi:hypothetical protein